MVKDLDITEIKPGLVLCLDQSVCFSEGKTSLANPSLYAMSKLRSHVCIYREGPYSVWVPLFSSAGAGRYRLTEKGRHGHPNFTGGVFRAHCQNVWLLTPGTLARAAKDDLSRPDNRNYFEEVVWIVEPHTEPGEQLGPLLDMSNLRRVFSPIITGSGAQMGFVKE